MLRRHLTITSVLLAAGAVTSLPAATAGLSVLPGSVTISDGSAIPTGSRLRVELHDMSPGVAKDATVATETVEAAGKTPFWFELSYNESVIEPKRLYGVAAMILDDRDQVLWETRVPIRVLTLGNQKKVALILRPSERPKAPPEPTSFAVECEGLRFKVNLNDASATVVLPESKLVLPRTESFAGKRYSDGASVLSVSGSAVYFQGPKRAYRDCKIRKD